MFEVSQFDSYSYLFTGPFFIMLDGTATPGNIPIAGMRIGINGARSAGRPGVVNWTPRYEHHRRADAVGPDAVDTRHGHPAREGPDGDEFFLTFEMLGTHTNVVVEPAPLPPPPPADVPPRAGHRRAQVRRDQRRRCRRSPASARRTRRVKATYRRVKQQLPGWRASKGSCRRIRWRSRNSRSSTAARWWTTPTLRGAYFPASTSTQPVDTAFDTAARTRPGHRSADGQDHGHEDRRPSRIRPA